MGRKIWMALGVAVALIAASPAEGQETNTISNLSDAVSQCVDAQIDFWYSPVESLKICNERKKSISKMQCVDDLTLQWIWKEEAFSKCWVSSDVKLIGPVELCLCSDLNHKKNEELTDQLNLEEIPVS